MHLKSKVRSERNNKKCDSNFWEITDFIVRGPLEIKDVLISLLNSLGVTLLNMGDNIGPRENIATYKIKFYDNL